MDRRTFLQHAALTGGALGGGLGSLVPGVLQASRGNRPTRRLVCIGMDLSLRPESFFPTSPGLDYALSPLLKPMERWKDRMTVFSQLDHPGVVGGHAAVHAFLTGVRRDQRSGFAEGCLSLDQLVAREMGHETRYPSLAFGLGGGDSLSWTQSGIALPKLQDPGVAWRELFTPQNQRDRERLRAAAKDDLSVASLVEAEARLLKDRLDSFDREKLAEFSESLESFEAKTRAREAWIDQPRPEPGAPAPRWNEDRCIDQLRATFEVMALALQSDSSRVLTCNVGVALPVVGQIEGVTRSYHDLSHSGQSPEKLAELHRVESSVMGELDHFLTRLDGMRDREGESLLDNTIVLFGSGMGNASSHSSRNLPVLIAGGDLNHAGHLFFEKKGTAQTPLCNLYVTLLQWLGLERDSFGTSNGNLNQLLS